MLLLIGSLSIPAISSSPTYLLQQLGTIGAFLGVITVGLLMVVLLGHVDLSIPWVVTMGGMMATAAGGFGQGGWPWRFHFSSIYASCSLA